MAKETANSAAKGRRYGVLHGTNSSMPSQSKVGGKKRSRTSRMPKMSKVSDDMMDRGDGMKPVRKPLTMRGGSTPARRKKASRRKSAK